MTSVSDALVDCGVIFREAASASGAGALVAATVSIDVLVDCGRAVAFAGIAEDVAFVVLRYFKGRCSDK